ncbi:MAG: efflux RND transporter periplasmic adaptor subunit [Polyangiaceae bacterium]
MAPRPRATRSWSRRLRWLIFPAMIAAVAAAIVFVKNRPINVTAMRATRGTAIDAVYGTGTVEAEDRVDVKAKSAGSILELLVKEGSIVKKGDLLARIDNPMTTFDLKRGEVDRNAAAAQASLNAPQIAALRAQAVAIQADLAVARQDLARTEELAKANVNTLSELERARARVAQLEANLAANDAQQRATRIDLSANAERLEAAYKSLATRVKDTEVRAPLDGVVLARKVELGEVVSVNQTLFRVGDISRLILEVSVDEADIAKVFDGRTNTRSSIAAVSLFAFPNQSLRASVFEILPDANRDRKSFLAKLRLDAPPAGLRSGMSAEVNIVSSERPNVLLVPLEAIAENQVWVAKDDKAVHVPVKLGLKDLLRVEVLEGVNEGDVVIVDGQDKLKDGSRVSVTEKAMDRLQPAPDLTQPQKTSIR